MRVHEEMPDVQTLQPVYVEPIQIGMKTGEVELGDHGAG